MGHGTDHSCLHSNSARRIDGRTGCWTRLRYLADLRRCMDSAGALRSLSLVDQSFREPRFGAFPAPHRGLYPHYIRHLAFYRAAPRRRRQARAHSRRSRSCTYNPANRTRRSCSHQRCANGARHRASDSGAGAVRLGSMADICDCPLRLAFAAPPPAGEDKAQSHLPLWGKWREAPKGAVTPPKPVPDRR